MSTSRAIKAVAMGITQLLANEWIKFPNTNEKRAALKERFQKERNFKGVIGCIDCTHVAIVRPTHHEESYLNHKGFHSINVQAIASHDLEILNINARFPGSVHDNFIWRYSAVSDFMQQFYDSGDRSTWLLGDAGYGLEPWLMTPITDAAAESAEARYTQCHTSTRNCIERSFGLLKNVWRCLLSHRVLHYAPIMASNIIIACAVLHNIRLSYNLIDKEYDINEESEAAAVQRAALQQNIEAHNRVRALEIAGADEGKRCTWTRCIWTQPITAPCD
ncbi:putative nuclease HARBI1 isoform X2 [Odontomachus brunneus]|uniref:putative nuclease HARBI1 isoform X2 n=1 Tax=Odontomachus brunneus TaxID=486640 RepID=UPI0013F1F3B2|nr:putative nuclease HARBI1 isoform X2 [Odontomachus brunneus]